MKSLVYIFTGMLLLFASCKEKEEARTTGTDTVDNVRYMGTTYYVYGFTFSGGKLVSTENTPGPDITVDTLSNAPYSIVFQTSSLRPSFYRFGNYFSVAEAKSAFDGLKSFGSPNWTEWAEPVLPNQIWIFKSSADRYTKLRIISTTRRKEKGVPVVEVTFEWVHQPDGSLTFP